MISSICLSVCLSDTTLRSHQLLGAFDTQALLLFLPLIYFILFNMDAQAQIQVLQEQFAVEMQHSALQINTLSSQLDLTLSTIKTLQNQICTNQRKPYLPDIDKFDGIAYHFDTWLPSIKAKLLIDKKPLETQLALVNSTMFTFNSNHKYKQLYSHN